MSLERLLAKIEDDAREEGRSIVEDAKADADMIRREGREEADALAESIRAGLREKGEKERTKIMSEALAESRTAFLSAQDQLFEDTFTEALHEFENLPEERYRAWLKRVIVSNTSSGEETIQAAPYDRRLLEKGLLKEINAELRKHKRKGAMKLADGEADIRRGVILVGEKFINNLSLETLMREVREKHEEDVLKIIFGEVDVRGVKK